MGIRHIKPQDLHVRDLHQILLGSIAPRPIAFVGTIGESGVSNLAPFSFFNVFSANPPLVIFSPARRGRDNTTKDTYDNLRKVGECTVNIVNYPMVNQMVLASTEYAKEIDEFEKAGFTPADSELISPKRVAESPVSYECRIKDFLNYGELPGGGNIFIAEVIMIHLNEAILGDDGKIDPYKIDTVGRLGKAWYTRPKSDLFELNAPSGKQNIGFDGLPAPIKNSPILTGNDLGLLAMEANMPNAEEVSAYLDSNQELSETCSRLAKDQEGLEIGLHQRAQRFLVDGNTREAWLWLLSNKQPSVAD